MEEDKKEPWEELDLVLLGELVEMFWGELEWAFLGEHWEALLVLVEPE